MHLYEEIVWVCVITDFTSLPPPPLPFSFSSSERKMGAVGHLQIVNPIPVIDYIIYRSYPITYYWTGLLIMDHSYLVGNLTNSKIAETKALEPLKS